MHKNIKSNLRILKYPIINIKGKAATCLGRNQYTFIVDRQVDKRSIKTIFENLYSVKVTKINTITLPRKKVRRNKFIGWKPQYKKVIISLSKQDSVKLLAKLTQE